MTSLPATPGVSRHLVLYDGVCGLCDRANRFIVRHDVRQLFQFSALQGTRARKLVSGFGRDPDLLDTVCVVADYQRPEQRLLTRSAAALFVLQQLGSPWKWAVALRLFPTFVLDAIYNFVARHRYRWFGQVEQCSLPDPAERARFLED